MTTQPPNRLTQLPGYDTAPDVYETTLPSSSSTARSTSSSPARSGNASDTTNEDSNDEDATTSGYGVSRRRLYPERARSRFGAQSRGVGVEGADFGERVDGGRKGFSRRKSRRGDEEEEEEGLEARIARLRREVEECKILASAAESEQAKGGNGKEGYLEELGKMMGELDFDPQRKDGGGHKRTGSKYHDAPTTPSATPTQLPTSADEQTLTAITTFESRLTALETSLGLTSLDNTSENLSAPLLPTLTLLDHQFSTLTSATSLSALEAAAGRIQRLRTEAAELSTLQSQRAVPATNGRGREGSDDDDVDSADEDTKSPASQSALLNADDLATLTSLHAILPQLQTLTPLIPALTTRLRSLRTLHTTAASAAQDLDGIEKRQVEMEKELKAWREGLESVEEKVREAGEANGRNGEVVKRWVEELAERCGKLGR